tara:strand:- start:675 stop:1061 length:387 start_codon:yes stop_codon:yes gene_type:complete
MAIEDLRRINEINDKKLSQRDIVLDPSGYFIIKTDQISKKIFVEHYLNNIDSKGIALDPLTNKPIKCDKQNKRQYNKIFKGNTAKEIGILITEKNNNLISKLDHALYLGRELQKAEECLLRNEVYIQD